MKTMILLLAVLAAAQVIIAGVLHMDSTKVATQSERSKLLHFEVAAVDGLTIKAGEETISLKRQAGAGDSAKPVWLTAAGFPADQNKVEALLNSLKGLQVGLAVATTDEAAQRFKVAADDFERQLTLHQDDTELATLFIGTGAGARRSHARMADSDAIYSVSLGSYEVPAELGDWQDKSVLQLDQADVTGMQLNELKLTKKEAIWSAISGLPAGRALSPKAVDEAVSPLLSLRFSEVLGTAVQDSYGLAEPELALTLNLKDGARDYQFGKLAEGDDYALKVSDRDEYFKVAAYSVKPLLEKLTLDGLLLEPDVAADVAAPEPDATPTTPSVETGETSAPEQPVSTDATGETAVQPE